MLRILRNPPPMAIAIWSALAVWTLAGCLPIWVTWRLGGLSAYAENSPFWGLLENLLALFEEEQLFQVLSWQRSNAVTALVVHFVALTAGSAAYYWRRHQLLSKVRPTVLE